MQILCQGYQLQLTKIKIFITIVLFDLFSVNRCITFPFLITLCLILNFWYSQTLTFLDLYNLFSMLKDKTDLTIKALTTFEMYLVWNKRLNLNTFTLLVKTGRNIQQMSLVLKYQQITFLLKNEILNLLREHFWLVLVNDNKLWFQHILGEKLNCVKHKKVSKEQNGYWKQTNVVYFDQQMGAGQNHLFSHLNKFFVFFRHLQKKRKKKERKAAQKHAIKGCYS